MLHREPDAPRLAPTAVDRLKLRLERALGPSKVLSSPEALAAFAGDESENEPVLPDVAVRAETSEDVRKTLRVALEERAPVTPRAGGSGKSGGCIPVHGGIALATIGLTGIREIDRAEHIAVVEPGVVLADLHRSVEAEGLFYPPDANSLAWCALGGNVAENAAGPRAFKYGSTRDYVLGLEIALMGGEHMSVGRRTKKGVTGYDLTALLVGSEGTLAVTTQATLRLIPKPETVVTLLALFRDVQACGRAVQAVLEARVVPRCIELLDQWTLSAVRKQGVPIDEGASAMLILEVDGSDATSSEEAERVGTACDGAGALTVLVAQDEAQRDRLWAARRALSGTTRAMARFKVSEDVVVPRRHIADLLDEVDRIRERIGIKMLAYGHAGDGNLHVNYLWDEAEQVPGVRSGLEQLFHKVIELGGTLTGEHGVGLSKARFLPLEQSESVIDLQRGLKHVFDPNGLLNPGKIFPDHARSLLNVNLKVIGIDPGTRHLGWGVLEQVGTRITHVAHGVIDTDTTQGLAPRLVEIDDALERILAEHAPTVASVEALFYAKDPQAAAKLGHARGVVLLRLARSRIKVFEIPPARVKRAVVGGGLATKDQVARVITQLLRLPEVPRPDAADALANAFAHLTMAKFAEALEAQGARLPPTRARPSRRPRAR